MENYIVLVTYDIDSFHAEIKNECKNDGFKDEAKRKSLPASTLYRIVQCSTAQEAVNFVKAQFLKCIKNVALQENAEIEVQNLLVAVIIGNTNNTITNNVVVPQK